MYFVTTKRWLGYNILATWCSPGTWEFDSSWLGGYEIDPGEGIYVRFMGIEVSAYKAE